MNQREMQSGTRSKMTLQIHLKAIEGTHPHSAIVLGEQIAYQDAKIERLKKELAEATAKLDALKVDPAKREELIAECHGRFQAGFPEALRFVWLERGEQFRSGFAAAIEHASDAGRAAANELRALRTFRAEIEQDYQAWANATIGEAELRIRLGVARNKVDKAIAGQGGTGKEGR